MKFLFIFTPMLHDIFNTGCSDEIIIPPRQVFKNTDFTYLLAFGITIGYDERQYGELLHFLKMIGEQTVYYVENSENRVFDFSLSVDSTYNDLQNKFKSLGLDCGFVPYEVFIHGDLTNWGIYICECPTLVIIGCVPELADRFRQIYQIRENGYQELKDFISQEYNRNSEMISVLEENYRLI